MVTRNGEGWVIGIGSSAGGLEAVSQFLSNLPEDFRASIIIAQHLAPHAKSMMVELLSKTTPLKVVGAENAQKIEPAVVYVAPPNHDIDIVDGHIELTVAGPETRPKPSVDEFFASLAKAYGERSVGIILSGTGSDGAEGVRAIRSAGGVTLAQDDQSAKYDGMPRSAIDTGSIDSILPPESLAKSLLQILHDHEARLESEKVEHPNLKHILGLIREKHGTDFSKYKSATIQRRVAKRMGSVGVESLSDYYELLARNPGELSQLAQELLVSVTSFFRDSEVFRALRPKFMQLLEAKKSGEEFRIWVAGCATGEEAYSYAIMLTELQEQLRKPVFIKVFATDLDADAVYEARSGIYSERDITAVPPEYLRFFTQRDGGRVEVSKSVRDLVVFARQDLIQNPPFVRVDVISCRNVLIYFEQDLQKRLLETFHYALNPSGVLVLGKSETVSVAAPLFDAIDRKLKVFEKLNVASKLVPPTRVSNVTSVVDVYSPRRSEAANPLAEAGYLKLLETHGICGVIADDQGNLVQILGNVSPFLTFHSRIAELRLATLVPKDLAIEIPLLIRKASTDGGSHQSRSHQFGREDSGQVYHVIVQPLQNRQREDQKKLFLISFETQKIQKTIKYSDPGDKEYPARVAELEQELHITREHLQTVIEELGVSNEELQALNEELSSTNEELQASTEELETTNEELQSSNEELTTVNEELTIKSSELRVTSVTLENIQNSIGLPLVVLDTRKRITRYNHDATKIFQISPADIGRELHQVTTFISIPDLDEKVAAAISRGEKAEAVCESLTNVFQMRVMPSLDEYDRVIGAIVTFYDNTEELRLRRRLSASELRIRAILDASPGIISLKDSSGRYTLVNNAFCEFFGMREEEIIGRTDRELFSDEFATAQRDADLEILLKRTAFRREEVLLSGANKRHVFLTSRFPIGAPEPRANPTSVGMIAFDVTTAVDATERLEASENRYRAIVEDQAVFVCRHTPDARLNFVNTALAGYFGGSPESYLGETFYRLVDESDRERIQKEISLISAARPVVQYDHRTTRFGNQQRWLRWIHRGIFTGDGKAIEYQAVGFDITETRDVTDQLMEKEAVYAGIFSNTSDFISVFRHVNGELLLESVNRSAERALGYGFAQLVGRKIEELLSEETRERTLSRYHQVIRSVKPEAFEEELYLPGGGVKYFSTTLVPIPGADGQVERVAALSRDISDHKTIEKDLRRAKDAAEVANRAKSDFLAAMSHELRTPLNVVLGLSEILSESQLNQEQKGYATSINRSGKVLLSLIEDVLDISKIEAGKIRLEAVPFSIATAVKEVVDLFSVQAKEKNIKIITKFDNSADRHVIGDPGRLRQVLVNLIGNAIKFTDHGSVTIEATGEQGADGHHKFFFKVRDTGIGIKPEDHSKIFQKFSQVEAGHNRRFGGTGLGLVISKQLVQLMRGEIGFESEIGSGSCFWFHVQMPIATKENRKAISSQTEEASLEISRPLKVLAIDDNRESQNVIGLFLKRLGHQAVLASSGYEAIQAIENDHFDIVLMDVQMPGMDGYDATRRIRSMDGARSKLPIIALTANAMSGDAEKCFAAGMDDYLSKPLQIAELKRSLLKWGKMLVLHPESAAAQDD